MLYVRLSIQVCLGECSGKCSQWWDFTSISSLEIEASCVWMCACQCGVYVFIPVCVHTCGCQRRTWGVGGPPCHSLLCSFETESLIVPVSNS